MRELQVYDVRVLPGDSGFLLDDGVTSILVDTGFGFTGFRMADNIAKVLGERRLDYIFLTHSHYDHALGSAYVLRRYPEATVVAGRYAASVFPRPGAQRVMRELDGKFAAENGVTDYEFLGEELRVDIACDDGDTVQAGDMRFTVVDLPGHTKCSVGYYCPERKFLIATESLGVYDGRELIVPTYLVDYDASLASIDRVCAMEVESFLSPHLGLLNAEQRDFFLQNARAAAVAGRDFILQRVAAGMDNEAIFADFREAYANKRTAAGYPPAAMRMNTMIMIEMLKRGS